jgi:hypothetical protein
MSEENTPGCVRCQVNEGAYRWRAWEEMGTLGLVCRPCLDQLARLANQARAMQERRASAESWEAAFRQGGPR